MWFRNELFSLAEVSLYMEDRDLPSAMLSVKGFDKIFYW